MSEPHEEVSRMKTGLSLVLVMLLAFPRPANASVFGEENGALTTLVAQGIAMLTQAAETFKQLKETYDETKKYVGMVQDAINGFNEFRAFADSIVRDPNSALANMLPDAAYLVRDIQSPSSWGQGTGELQRLVSVCLSGEGPVVCAQFHEVVTAAEAKAAISRTFGTTPLKNAAIETLDTEAAVAIRGGMAGSAKASVAAAQAKALMKHCTEGTDNAAVQACQSAAALGQLMELEQVALMNEQLAEANRLKAIEMSAKNAEAKRNLTQALDRQRMLEEGAKHMAPVPYQFGGTTVGLERPR